MRLLLLNNNPAVSRLIKLSAEKAGYALDEFEEYGLVPQNTYDVILVDNEVYDEISLDALKEHVHSNYVVYICQRGAKKPEALNVALEKPFLPTDFLVLLDKIKNVLSTQANEIVSDDMDEEVSDIQENKAFDIDKIDTLQEDDEDEALMPLNLLDDEPLNALEDDENELSLDALDLGEINHEDALFELPELSDTEEEKEEEELDNETEETVLDLEATELPSLEEDDKSTFEDFDFENAAEGLSSDDDLKLDDIEDEEIIPSILDKDDINEVKQLLDENDDGTEEPSLEDEALSLEDPNLEDLDALSEENESDILTLEETPLSLLEDLEEDSLDTLLDDESLSTLDDKEELTLDELELGEADENEMAEASLEEESSLETQEEIIDDFEEDINEKIEEDIELNGEALTPSAEMTFDDLDLQDDIASLDDLNEKMLQKAFGGSEESEESDLETSDDISAANGRDEEKIEVIRDEIQNSLARSISGLTQSDILREALKGMRINISISFDDKE